MGFSVLKHNMELGMQGADINLHSILTSVICGCAWTASRCGCFILRECPLDTYMVGICMSTVRSLHVQENIFCSCREWNSVRPVTVLS